jgi:hypothetical protein
MNAQRSKKSLVTKRVRADNPRMAGRMPAPPDFHSLFQKRSFQYRADPQLGGQGEFPFQAAPEDDQLPLLGREIFEVKKTAGVLFPNGALDVIDDLINLLVIVGQRRRKRGQPLASRAADTRPRFFFRSRAGCRCVAFAGWLTRTAFSGCGVNAEFLGQPFADALGRDRYFFSVPPFCAK